MSSEDLVLLDLGHTLKESDAPNERYPALTLRTHRLQDLNPQPLPSKKFAWAVCLADFRPCCTKFVRKFSNCLTEYLTYRNFIVSLVKILELLQNLQNNYVK